MLWLLLATCRCALVRWLALLLLGAVLGWVLARALGGIGLDPRGGVLDTYVQRNTLVVGFAMGFAVIPIIYTIAEDAMSAVPSHLRGASLACGATPWQTAIGIVVPTAMSGIFAAVMIGMGRAVGETMIVVMAAGLAAKLTVNPLDNVTTVTVQIVTLLVGDQEFDSAKTLSAFALGLVLFVVMLGLNVIALRVVQKYREKYD